MMTSILRSYCYQWCPHGDSPFLQGSSQENLSAKPRCEEGQKTKFAWIERQEKPPSSEPQEALESLTKGLIRPSAATLPSHPH
jgi:hypothetical protein